MDAITDIALQDQEQDLFFTFRAEGDPKAELAVRSFKVDEGLSRLFTVELELASRRADIDLTKLVDKPGCLTIADRYGEPRHFHGLVERAQKGPSGRPNEAGQTWTMYKITLMPALHKLRYGSDCRIFQAMTVPEIVETILTENGVADYRFSLAETHGKREFNVQYRESMLDYVERLLAEEGIYYSHEHEDGKHVLVMSDRSVTAADCEHAEEIEYNANPGGDVKGPQIRHWCWNEIVRSSSVVLNDYTFRNPNAGMIASHEATRTNGLTSKLAMYDYPGRYKDIEVGKNFARWELEALRSDASCGEGVGRCQHFSAGTQFSLKGHDDKACNRRYLLTAVTHEGTQPQAMEESAGDKGGTFLETRFAVVDGATPWRPLRKAKPVVDGPEVATVTGPDGEEIFTDEYSRIKVKFPWDRHGKSDDTSSCWIRVAQAWGGGTYGNVAIPRIGHEVIISFLHGDPDQPICTGRTYHANNHTPYQLPDNKTKMAIRSDTHKGSGYNELSFEDQNGEQNFFMHAEKDQTIKVKNNQSSRIDANAVHSIGANHSLEVGTNMSHQVGGGMNQVIGGVGAAAAGLIGQGLSGLMGQSAGLLQQGMNIAMQAMQAAGSSGSGSGAAKAAEAVASAVLGQAGGGSAAGATPGFNPAASSFPSSMPMASSGFVATKSSGPSLADMEKQFGKERTMKIMTNGGGWGGGINEKSGPSLADMEKQFGKERTMEIMTNGGGWGGGIAEKGNQPTVEPLYAAPNEPSALGQEASTFAGLLSGGGLGALGQIVSSFDGARQGINAASAYSLFSGGGAGMASAGSQLATQVGSMIGGGILNQLVSKFVNQTTGIAVNETVGHVKVTTVGQAFMQKVGNTYKVDVGDEFTIAVGAGFDKDGNPTPPQALFVMKKDGSVVIKGKKFNFEAEGAFQQIGKVIDLN